MAPLTYASFWKWNANKKKGIPAYIIVRNDKDGKPYAELVKLDKGMKYVPSAAFSYKLGRRLYSAYPSYLFRSSHFEIDENGKPFYITPYEKRTIGLYGGTKIEGAVITDPVTGKMSDHKLKDIPSWVDLVVDGDLITEQYDYYGTLRNGSWDSVIGQKGCVETTKDYGYVSDGTDIWIFTGVTSVTGDSSNLGFILGNERTGEVRYITCDGADERSAMGAAEGEVQEKGYTASFPSLITIDKEPTYVMILKDKNDLTKAYACVNVARYDQVAVAEDPESCFDKYRKLIHGDLGKEEASGSTAVNTKKDTSDKAVQPVQDAGCTEKRNITITKILNVNISGTSCVYIRDKEKNLYRAVLTDVIDILRYDTGDKVTIYINPELENGVYDFSLKPAGRSGKES